MPSRLRVDTGKSQLLQPDVVLANDKFVLRWAPDPSHPFQEIVRQQWNFSPAGSNIELEDYRVNLNTVGVLELIVSPDVGREEAFASLDELRIA
jgi:hypothetical protein